MENIKKVTLLTYTHTNTSDVQLVYFEKIKKYFKKINHVVLNNDKINGINVVVYKNTDKYYEQMVTALNKIETDYIIYSQEDYILYDNVDIEAIDKLIKIFDDDEKISFIRLINSGIDFLPVDYNQELFFLDENHQYFFSTQITIWRKKDLIEMFLASKAETIWDEPKNSKFLKEIKKIGLCVKDKGRQIGGHFDSKIYPYIATAIVKGKWNTKEYNSELIEIFKEYNIDEKIRGTNA